MAWISLDDAKLKMQLYGRLTDLLAVIWMLMWINIGQKLYE